MVSVLPGIFLCPSVPGGHLPSILQESGTQVPNSKLPHRLVLQRCVLQFLCDRYNHCYSGHYILSWKELIEKEENKKKEKRLKIFNEWSWRQIPPDSWALLKVIFINAKYTELLCHHLGEAASVRIGQYSPQWYTTDVNLTMWILNSPKSL